MNQLTWTTALRGSIHTSLTRPYCVDMAQRRLGPTPPGVHRRWHRITLLELTPAHATSMTHVLNRAQAHAPHHVIPGVTLVTLE